MPMTWSHEADAKLLIGILSTSSVKLDFDALSKWMGPECTVYAIQHRIRKLQEKANSVPTDAGSAPSSPEKRKRGRPKKNGNGAIDDEQNASPKKKTKNEVAKEGNLEKDEADSKEDGLFFGDS